MVKVGQRAQQIVEDYEDHFLAPMTEKEKVTNLEFEVLKIKERNDQISRELAYQKYVNI